jgi:hypothetical protein
MLNPVWGWAKPLSLVGGFSTLTSKALFVLGVSYFLVATAGSSALVDWGSFLFSICICKEPAYCLLGRNSGLHVNKGRILEKGRGDATTLLVRNDKAATLVTEDRGTQGKVHLGKVPGVSP